MKSIILQILTAFKRDRLFRGITFLIICCSGFAYFIGSNAVVEAQEAKIVYTAGLSRIAIIIGFITYVAFYIKRMFENHEIEVVLSHSISRTKVLLSMFIGFLITFLTLLIPVAIILLLLGTNITYLLVWFISLICEGALMLCFTLCCSFIIKNFTNCIAGCYTMYIVGRTIGNFVAYLTLSLKTNLYNILESILKCLSVLFPRLDIFGKTSWLIYGDFSINNILLFLSQTIIFCCIFLCMAIIDLNKKEF